MSASTIIVLAFFVILLSMLFKPIARIFRVYWKTRHIRSGDGGKFLLGHTLKIGMLKSNERLPYLVGETRKAAANGDSMFRIWMGPSCYIVPCNGQTLKDILDSNEELEKGDAYDFLEDWIGNGLLISVGQKWRHRRKMITPSFHFGMLASYMETFNYHARIMQEILEEHAGKEFNMYSIVKRAALDIICDAAMGVTASAQTNPNHPYVKAVGKYNTMTTDYVFNPWLRISPLYKALGHAKTKQDQLDVLIPFSKNVIRERREEIAQGNIQERNGKKTFLDMLLTFEGLTDRDVQDEVDTFMFEGHDTTSSGTCWIIWCLACFPKFQEKVYQEIFELFGDSDRDIENEDLPKLLYFDRFIKECLRFRPPVPLIQRRLINDFKMGDELIPRDTLIMISPYCLHHNPQLFPNPDKFDPDRFLPENIGERHPYDYIPFSAGPRNCVGQKFAVYEQKCIVSWILRRFRIEASGSIMSNKPCPEVVLVPDSQLNVTLHKRTHN